jgi:hypothetical protein
MKELIMKKIPALAAMLCALALGACSNFLLEKPQPASGGNSPDTDVSQGIPEGFGAIEVALSQGAARTVMPLADNLYLEYWFTKAGWEGPEEKTPEAGTFLLEPGIYSLTVRAFADSDHEDLAAEGTTEEDFPITAGLAATVNVTLHPIVSEGEGSLEFSLSYPAGTTVETLTLTRIAGEDTYDLQTEGTDDGLAFSGVKNSIPAGYYFLRVVLKNAAGLFAGKTEAVHIYRNLSAEAVYTFSADDFLAYVVSTAANSGPGSLRQAITDVLAVSGALKIIQVLLPAGSVIELESALPQITKSITIEGNGVTLTTRASSWTGKLLYINSSSAVVTIRGVHFKNGLATDYGGAVYFDASGKTDRKSVV